MECTLGKILVTPDKRTLVAPLVLHVPTSTVLCGDRHCTGDGEVRHCGVGLLRGGRFGQGTQMKLSTRVQLMCLEDSGRGCVQDSMFSKLFADFVLVEVLES